MSMALSLATNGMICCAGGGVDMGGDYMELPRKPLVVFKGYNTIEKTKNIKKKITINASLENV